MDRSNKKIVVVDDDPTFASLLAMNFRDVGFDVAVMLHADAALAFAESGAQIDVWVLDWEMPGIDGISLLRSLRQRGHDQPTLFLTGHTNPIFEEHGLREGAIDFVDKGKSFSIILQRLKIAIESKHGKSTAAAPQITLEGLRILWQDQDVDLTATEARVVRLMLDQAGRDVSYRAIYDAAKGEGFLAGGGTDGYRSNVRSIVRRIRRRFQVLDPEFCAIEAYPGVGYRWRVSL